MKLSGAVILALPALSSAFAPLSFSRPASQLMAKKIGSGKPAANHEQDMEWTMQVIAQMWEEEDAEKGGVVAEAPAPVPEPVPAPVEAEE